MAMHAGELPVDTAVMRDLVDAHFPQWPGLHVRRVTLCVPRIPSTALTSTDE
jgi:hypothetical protein